MKKLILIVSTLFILFSFQLSAQDGNRFESMEQLITVQENVISTYQKSIERLAELKPQNQEEAQLIQEKMEFSRLSIKLAKMKIKFLSREIKKGQVKEKAIANIGAKKVVDERPPTESYDWLWLSTTPCFSSF